MPLAAEDLQEIGQYVQAHLSDWMPAPKNQPLLSQQELEIRERIVRVEEALKHQGELLEKLILQIDRRFDAMQKQMDKRFEQVDKRFEQVDKRFEQVDKRFESLTKRIDRFMVWSFGLYVTMTGLIVAIIKYT